ncbi:MAG: phenylacetic acid degradation protein PaaN [Phycisphaerae bacterium]|jgi:phenylacetic acid degradation protein paaN|nr:phenylacetic acid degradation protein PaaN [Phycisphaerae bacterium]
MSTTLFTTHEQKLQQALQAVHNRGFYSAYPEVPSGKIYGQTAKADGLEAFDGYCGADFALKQGGCDGTVGNETSPYGISLKTQYPKANIGEILECICDACPAWRNASIETRVGCAMEILDRLNKRSFEMAFAVMHTSGQGFMMAFQAGGPHAQDRGLEAIAYAYKAMKDCPEETTWKKQVGRDDFVTLDKTYKIVPRGIGLVIGCSTFPTWNTYPGLFASLVTGNAVIVKPHPGAILPLAITVDICQDVLTEAGFDANLVTLVPDTLENPITTKLVARPEIQIIDYTGGTEFGNWVEANAGSAVVYTEKAGVNSVIIDSVEQMKAVSGNLAFSLCLYSGQMCTTPQNIFVPRAGIDTADGHISFDDVANAIVKGVDWMLSDQGRANEVLGAIQNEATAARIDSAAGDVLRDGVVIEHTMFSDARTRTVKIIKLDASQRDVFEQEMFGPLVYIISTDSTDQSIELAASIARSQGAISCGLYSTNDEVIEKAVDAMSLAGVPVSCNLVGNIWVNQSAAFSDFHVSGANPSGNATLSDAAFVVGRFNMVQCRTFVPESSKVEA